MIDYLFEIIEYTFHRNRRIKWNCTDQRSPIWDCWTHFKAVQPISRIPVWDCQIDVLINPYALCAVTLQTRTLDATVERVRTGWPQTLPAQSWLSTPALRQLLALPWQSLVSLCCLRVLVQEWRVWSVRSHEVSRAERVKACTCNRGKMMSSTVTESRLSQDVVGVGASDVSWWCWCCVCVCVCVCVYAFL